MVQFILGRSGTGKTTLCIREIIESLLYKKSEQNLVYLVPEQATYQAEKAILSDSRIKGYSRLHVLSFQRLCFLIFGKNLAARDLTKQGRDMIVHKLIVENSNKLSIFLPNTASGIANTITELQQFGKTPVDIDNLIEKLKNSGNSQLTCSKLTDINLIFRQYLAFVEGNFLNNDNQLNLARELVAHQASAASAPTSTPFLKNCLLWVDGFASFTGSEMLLLVELLKVSASSKIALCIDPAVIQSAEREWSGIFEPIRKTYTDLLSCLKELKLSVEKPVILSELNRFKDSKALGHLEKNIFSFEPVPPASASESIKITACAKVRLEVDYVARRICSLVRSENYRWRDCAVIASDIDQYRHYIQAIFKDFDIPFFIDRRRDLQQYPAVELITSALKIASGSFTAKDIVDYLKSDLVPVGRDNIDRLENYCLAFGVEPGNWIADEVWDFAAADDSCFDNKEIDNLRRKATEHLLVFRTLVQNSGAITAGRFRDGLLALLDNLNVRGQLSDWTKAAFEQNRLDEAQMHQQFFGQFTQLMDDFVFIFKDSVLSAKQYASIINSALSRMTVALIPPAIDQVLIGSIERSRHPDLKAVFLVGATQQQFPVPVYYDNILDDGDRKAVGDTGFELSRTASAQLMERRYLAYIAFTRPSCLLYITYPLLDEKGAQVQMSFLVTQLKTLFNDLCEEKYFGSNICLNKSDLAILLASRLGKDNLLSADDMDAKYKWLLDTVSEDYDLSRVKMGIEYKNTAVLACCDNDYSRQNSYSDGNLLTTSATKLASFARCPFQYFARHVLELEERRIFELEPFSLGLFSHKVLELLFAGLKSADITLSDAGPDLLARLTDHAVKKLLTEDSFLRNFNARTKHNSFIIFSAAGMLKKAVLEFSEIASAGSFTQVASETGFGDRFSLPAVEIELKGGKKLRIEGKIDRIDAVCSAGRNYCLIIDYKQSQTAINWSLFSAGLDLQLPIYMLAVRNQTIGKYVNLVPVGGLYFQIQAFPQSADLDKAVTGPAGIIRKPKGIFNGEYIKFIDGKTEEGDSPYFGFYITKDGSPYGCYDTRSVLRPGHFEAIMAFAGNKISRFGERIFSGSIDINPYKYGKETACRYCAYKALCRFDWQINDYTHVKNVTKSEFFESIK